VTGSPFSAGSTPYELAIDPSGKYLYVAIGGADRIAGFSIDSATGALTPVPGSPVTGDGYVNFVVGDHGSLLSPTSSAAATGEMQGETLTYTGTGGTIVPGVVTPTVVQP
jgi:DNA-binding beta-propeller fold protein YncE